MKCLPSFTSYRHCFSLIFVCAISFTNMIMMYVCHPDINIYSNMGGSRVGCVRGQLSGLAPPGKSLVTIGFLKNSGTNPLKKQLDPLGPCYLSSRGPYGSP